MEDIPCELVINWDQTGIHYVPVSSWTMAKEGSERVEIAGIDDKRQMTAVFGRSMSVDFLPPQLIYTRVKRVKAFQPSQSLLIGIYVYWLIHTTVYPNQRSRIYSKLV